MSVLRVAAGHHPFEENTPHEYRNPNRHIPNHRNLNYHYPNRRYPNYRYPVCCLIAVSRLWMHVVVTVLQSPIEGSTITSNEWRCAVGLENDCFRGMFVC